MRVRLLYLGMLKELAGTAAEAIELPDSATAADLWSRIVERFPKMQGYERSIAISVNQEFAARSTVLREGDEVGLLPPVSGGVDAAPVELESEHCRIQHERIDSEAILRAIKHPEDGAVTLFDGIVRNNTRGRRTVYLNYEAYEGMALKQMEALAQHALANYKIRDVRLVHRLGRLEIGETSVLIVVASAHRGAAFDACRYLIDTLKKQVPIWKKEYFEDGAVWADGEPFPDSIPNAGE
jgi:molybdopterin converting factor subunit 1